MISQMNLEALIGRLQDHALADAPGTMSKAEVDAALALLDRVLPDLHYIELRIAGGSRQTRHSGDCEQK
jgi:hypothetical protein